MKLNHYQLIRLYVFLLVLHCVTALADTHYVDINNPNPSAPYTSWATAANDIQTAVDASSTGDSVLVADGVYNSGGAITPGYTSKNRVVITNNIVVQSVNGPEQTFIFGQGPNGNNAIRGVYLSSGILSGFTIKNGHTRTTGDYSHDRGGGGINMKDGGAAFHCRLVENSASFAGGGSCFGTLNYCTLTGNSAEYGGGGSRSTMNNCLIVGNSANRGGGSNQGELNNCTIIDNSVSGYLSQGGGSRYDTLKNCIVWNNSGGNAYNSGSYNSYSAPPLFMNESGGDYRLRASSPCIDAGNNAYVTLSNDLNGNTRIQGSSVDIGAYEFPGDSLVSLSASSISVQASEGGSHPPLSFAIWNSSGNNNPMDYSLFNDVAWMSISPANGYSTGEHDAITISFDTSDLPCGSYTGIITVASTDAVNTPLPLEVIVDITPISLELSTTSLSLNVPLGQSTTPYNFEIWNSAHQSVMNYTITDDADWLSVSPTNGTSTGERDWINVFFDTAILPDGYHTATITINSTDATNTPRTIHVFVDIFGQRLLHVNSSNTASSAPYTSWITAGSNIQDVVNVARDGDTILVTNGIYLISDEISILKNLSIQSVNGPAKTIIDAGGNSRCFHIDSPNIVLNGFTLTGGAAGVGGGLYINSTSGQVSNCNITGNIASNYPWDTFGGGVYIKNALLISNCNITSNSVSPHLWPSSKYQGGGVYCETPTSIRECQISKNYIHVSGNVAHHSYGWGIVEPKLYGGGIYFKQGGDITNSTISENVLHFINAGGDIGRYEYQWGEGYACVEGGGVYFENNGGTIYNSAINNNIITADAGVSYARGAGVHSKADNTVLSHCTLTGNLASGSDVASGGGAQNCTLKNCLIEGNSAQKNGGGAYSSTLINCTVVSNRALAADGTGGGIQSCTAQNSIIWNNTSTSHPNTKSCTLISSCTTPLHSGIGNITKSPLFRDENIGNYMLMSGSQCINGGNNAYVTSTIDLDGEPRIIDNLVDMGAYEFYEDLDDYDNDGLINAWEKRYFGSITNAIATADSDNDGHNNENEQTTGMNPTNASSVFAVTNFEFLFNETTNLVIEWPSITSRVYNIYWSPSLTNSFQNLKPNIHYPQNSYTVTVHGTESKGFYKMDVRLAE